MKNSVIIALVAAVVLTLVGLNYGTVEEMQVTVVSKERVTTGTGDKQKSFWLVFSEDEVFANKDNLLFFKFNSSDVQRELEVGKKCEVDVNWFRIPLLSTYRNIIRVHVCI